jgi:hypothetical protein
MPAEMMRIIDSAVPAAARKSRQLTIIAQDPSVKDARGRIVRARVAVPADWLAPGPRGQRFHVVDYDATAGVLLAPVDLTDPAADPSERPWTCTDAFGDADDATLETDPGFHAQNLYAVAARTLAAFEFALGRRLGWAFPGHQLYLVPHAFSEANAYYSDDDWGVFFGYLPPIDGKTVYTCLSHDIVAHETTHAILDGLRPRFLEPGLPDQPAFHEGFADVVALLSVFSIPSLVETTLGEADAQGRISADGVGEGELAHSALFGLAEQFGEATSGVRGSALRRSLELPAGDGWRGEVEFEEPHRRGEVIVATLMRTLVEIWTGRLKALIYGGGLDRERAAEEGAKSAEHLLQMAIRAIDYAPAVELEFEDFLDALLVADEVVAPDDVHGYRKAVRDAFAAFGIEQPEGRTVDLAHAQQRLIYENLNFSSLRFDRDEVFGFIWQNAATLGIERDYYLRVESVRPSVRVGPDGLIVNEVVADYVQTLNTTAAKAKALGVTVPDDVKDETQIQFWGGGTLIFDQFGMARLHETKPLHDWKRQSRRLEYLIRHGFYDRSKRLGFSLGTPAGMRFAEFHEPDARAGEEW